jgi:hypothetical protein
MTCQWTAFERTEKRGTKGAEYCKWRDIVSGSVCLYPRQEYILPPFLFIRRWIVQNCTIQRLIKRNGGSICQLDKLIMLANYVLTNDTVISLSIHY